MGCGSSSQVASAHERPPNGHKTVNGQNGSNGHHDHDDLPTVVLPETPAKPKPPIAFEIPLEEFDSNRRLPTTPPPHLQRLLQPPQPEISLPDIEEKLAEAELRRQSILQQRAASAQKRAAKMMKSFQEMDTLDAEHEPPSVKDKETRHDFSPEPLHPGQLMGTPQDTKHPEHIPHITEHKYVTNTVHIPPEPSPGEDKNI